MKKKINIPLTFISSLFTICACANQVKPVIKDNDRHYVENTLHDFNYNYKNGKQFVVNGESDYYIAYIKNNDASKAADYIVKQVKSCTGYTLKTKVISEDEIVSNNEHAIVIGSVVSFEQAGLTKTSKDIGTTGYQMETSGNAVYIITGGAQGYQLACIKFLELTLGFDLIYGDYIVFDRDGSVVPSMSIVEKPDFDFRKIDDLDTSWRYGAGFTDNNVFGTIGGQQYHNSFKYIPPATYYEDHPEWYNTTFGPDETKGQLCYTAHSHPEEVEKMVAIAAEKLIQEADAQPEMNNFTFTIQDNYNMCQCYGEPSEGWTKEHPNPISCVGKKLQYNGSNAGVNLEFANKIDDIVQKHYEGTGREIHLSIFAYHGTELAPTREENGQYVAIDGIKANPDVAVFCAFISSNFINSFYDTEKNADANMKAKSWESVSNRLYSWIYETNYAHYLYPFNTFTSMHETYRFLKEHSNTMVYTQGQHTASNRTCFNKLKLYISSKLMINVNLDVGPIIDKFFDRYYGEGASYMREFYEEMVSWCQYQEVRWPKIFKGGVSTGNTYLGEAEYWNENSLKKWENLCYKAIEQIAPLKEQDPYKYKLVSETMLGETIFPRWGLCNLFSSSYTSSELKQMRESFVEDCRKLNFDQYAENKTLSDYFQGTWGL